MMKIWEALNGNKTTIGAIFLFAATVMTTVVVGIWHVNAGWVDPLTKTFEWVGMAVTGLGLGHKAIK